MGVHHAVGVPVEVGEDDALLVLLHLHSHRAVGPVLHVSAGGEISRLSGLDDGAGSFFGRLSEKPICSDLLCLAFNLSRKTKVPLILLLWEFIGFFPR